MLARSAQVSTRGFTRSFHASRIRSAGHAAEPVPFSHKNKGTFALKVAAFFIAPFSIPFCAAKWQMYKSGAAEA